MHTPAPPGSPEAGVCAPLQAVELDHDGVGVPGAVTDADAPARAQGQLLAPQADLGLPVHRDIGAVGALVDQHELAAAPLDAGMLPRYAAVDDNDVAGRIAPEPEVLPPIRVEPQFPAAEHQLEARGRLLEARPERGQVLGVRPGELVDRKRL